MNEIWKKAFYEEWIGTADSFVNATIRAQVQGYLTKQNYKEGDVVRKGQTLFEIDPRTFQAALDQAKGQLAVQQAIWDRRSYSDNARDGGSIGLVRIN